MHHSHSCNHGVGVARLERKPRREKEKRKRHDMRVVQPVPRSDPSRIRSRLVARLKPRHVRLGPRESFPWVSHGPRRRSAALPLAVSLGTRALMTGSHHALSSAGTPADAGRPCGRCRLDTHILQMPASCAHNCGRVPAVRTLSASVLTWEPLTRCSDGNPVRYRASRHRLGGRAARPPAGVSGSSRCRPAGSDPPRALPATLARSSNDGPLA
jgi:hypothetical protein